MCSTTFSGLPSQLHLKKSELTHWKFAPYFSTCILIYARWFAMNYYETEKTFFVSHRSVSHHTFYSEHLRHIYFERSIKKLPYLIGPFWDGLVTPEVIFFQGLSSAGDHTGCHCEQPRIRIRRQCIRRDNKWDSSNTGWTLSLFSLPNWAMSTSARRWYTHRCQAQDSSGKIILFEKTLPPQYPVGSKFDIHKCLRFEWRLM